MLFGLTGLLGTSTPAFALELDRVVTVATPGMVPPLAPIATPSAVIDPSIPRDAPVARSSDPNTDYATLAAAVAAQESPDILDDESACMAGAVYFEAKGEPLSGQLAVAEVILNRTKSGRFPKSICSVVKQPGQFSFVRGGHVPAGSGPAWRTAIAVARVAMTDAWDGPAFDAMYFHARRVSPGWHRTKVAAIGNHIFYR